MIIKIHPFDLTDIQVIAILKRAFFIEDLAIKNLTRSYEGDRDYGFLDVYSSETGYQIRIFQDYSMIFESDAMRVQRIDILGIIDVLYEVGAIKNQTKAPNTNFPHNFPTTAVSDFLSEWITIKSESDLPPDGYFGKVEFKIKWKRKTIIGYYDEVYQTFESEKTGKKSSCWVPWDDVERYRRLE